MVNAEKKVIYGVTTKTVQISYEVVPASINRYFSLFKRRDLTSYQVSPQIQIERDSQN